MRWDEALDAAAQIVAALVAGVLLGACLVLYALDWLGFYGQ
jgi:hypothetical protein